MFIRGHNFRYTAGLFSGLPCSPGYALAEQRQHTSLARPRRWLEALAARGRRAQAGLGAPGAAGGARAQQGGERRLLLAAHGRQDHDHLHRRGPAWHDGQAAMHLVSSTAWWRRRQSGCMDCLPFTAVVGRSGSTKRPNSFDWRWPLAFRHPPVRPQPSASACASPR